MDPVTHTLVGVGIANAAFRRRVGRASVPVLALASNLPDIDAVVHLTGSPTAVLMRRTFGHSLLLLPFWCLALTWLLRRRFRDVSFGTLLGMVALGAAVHLFFDLINSFGVVLLWPFSGARPELAWVFIIDFVLTGLLVLPLLLCLAPALRPRLALLSRGALVAVALYLAACGAARARAGALLAAADAARSPVAAGPAEMTYVFPEPLGPERWRGVVRRDGHYDIYLVQPLEGRADLRRTIATDVGDPRVRAARGTPFGRRLEAFFKAPVWQAEGSANPAPAEAEPPPSVLAWDLRFMTLVLDRPAVFQFEVPVPAASSPRPTGP